VEVEEGMSAKLLEELFGRSAGPILLGVLVVLMTLVVTAFFQGRPIRVGRFSIGSRPQGGQSRLQPATRHDLAPAETAETAEVSRYVPGKVTRVFEVSEAKQFYSTIAPNYDERNSANLLATQLETIIRLEKARDLKPGLRVLDLGGGTGQNIATHFFSDRSIRWTYVDFCPAMVEQLDRHLVGHPMYHNLSRLVCDITQVHKHLQQKSYDVILLSLVLSSMPRQPDFAKLAGLLAPNGMLIISDINPFYTERHPYYHATARDGTVVAMRMKPVDPVEICQRASEAGLLEPEIAWQPKAADQLSGPTVSYSFIATFVAAAEPRSRHGRTARSDTARGRFRAA
jgi:ubiquinone/menaquinone biosynthesis C-methylase UbiE